MKLSVITINYNNREGLRKTIKSVVNQTYKDFEYIIIDGGSTDGSADVIKEYADRIDYWVSEKDGGIYNAMNKGVMAAHGEYCAFLNSGDNYCDNCVLEKVFEQNIKADIAIGSLLTSKYKITEAPIEVTMATFLYGTVNHPSSFIRKTLLIEHPYIEQYKISADREFFLWALINKSATYSKLPILVAEFDTTGISSVSSNDNDKRLIEEAVNQLLKPRIRKDYDIFMGKYDDYHRLFFLLSCSKQSKWIYKLVVVTLKILMFNSGFIKDFHLNGKMPIA